MSLLDAARSIQRMGPPDYDGIDLCCQRVQVSHDHAPDCPWLQMPQIVAALEAAQDVCDELEYGVESSTLPRLVAALKGEVVPTI